MNEFIVYWSFDNGKTLEHIGYEKLDNNGNYVFKRINTDTKELRKDWHLGMITDNQGNAKFYRFPHIGKTDIEGDKIYADSSIVEWIHQKNTYRGYFSFNKTYLRYEVCVFDGGDIQAVDYFYLGHNRFKIIGTLQEDKHLLGEYDVADGQHKFL